MPCRNIAITWIILSDFFHVIPIRIVCECCWSTCAEHTTLFYDANYADARVLYFLCHCCRWTCTNCLCCVTVLFLWVYGPWSLGIFLLAFSIALSHELCLLLLPLCYSYPTWYSALDLSTLCLHEFLIFHSYCVILTKLVEFLYKHLITARGRLVSVLIDGRVWLFVWSLLRFRTTSPYFLIIVGGEGGSSFA